MRIVQFKYLKHDLNRWFYPNDNVERRSFRDKVYIIIFTQGIWAVTMYRVMRWVEQECGSVLARRILRCVLAPFELLVQTVTGICIKPSTHIGPGLYIGHFGGIFLGDEVKIGKFCNLSQDNSIGWAGRGEKRGLPEIGDFVYVGPGAKIFGKIKIGSKVAIGANAVVTKDVPDNAVVAGVPARIISFNSGGDFVEFNRERSREVLEET